MAKKRNPPAAPPQNVEDVLLAECISRIDAGLIGDFAKFMFQKPKKGQESKRLCEAMIQLATLGWTFFHSSHSKPFKPAEREKHGR